MKYIPSKNVVAALFFAAVSCQAAVVYENLATSRGRLNIGALEVGDQIILEGSERRLTELSFYFFTSTNLSLNETYRVRFYSHASENDPPAEILFETPWLDVGGPHTNSTNIVIRNFVNGAVVPLKTSVPDSFTWSLQFQGIEQDEEAGLYIYGPPTIGNNYMDYWERGPNGWVLKELRLVPTGVDFAAQISALQELFMSRVGQKLVLHWPTTAVGYTLQSTVNFATNTAWFPVATPPVAVGGRFYVTNNTANAREFFRQRKP